MIFTFEEMPWIEYVLYGENGEVYFRDDIPKEILEKYYEFRKMIAEKEKLR